MAVVRARNGELLDIVFRYVGEWKFVRQHMLPMKTKCGVEHTALLM